MIIYKIFRAPEWAALQEEGRSAGAPVDLADGFIHFSTAAQLRETAARHFAGAEGLILAAVAAGALGDGLKWERSRGGAQFPHFYGILTRAHILWAAPLPLENGAHRFPAEIP